MGAGQQIVRKFPNGSSDMIEPMKPSKRHARFNKCVMALLLYLLKISGQNHKAETPGFSKAKIHFCLILRGEIRFSGSTVFNGKTIFTTKARRSRRKNACKFDAFFPFVYFVTFVVRLFPINYGRADFLCAFALKRRITTQNN
jgi:hypothetical protein